jgi:hypothetical protein
MIENDNIVRASLHAYPNPFDGKKISIALRGVNHDDQLLLKIYNHLGQLVFEFSFASSPESTLFEELELPRQLIPGIYHIIVGRLNTRVVAE